MIIPANAKYFPRWFFFRECLWIKQKKNRNISGFTNINHLCDDFRETLMRLSSKDQHYFWKDKHPKSFSTTLATEIIPGKIAFIPQPPPLAFRQHVSLFFENVINWIFPSNQHAMLHLKIHHPLKPIIYIKQSIFEWIENKCATVSWWTY